MKLHKIFILQYLLTCFFAYSQESCPKKTIDIYAESNNKRTIPSLTCLALRQVFNQGTPEETETAKDLLRRFSTDQLVQVLPYTSTMIKGPHKKSQKIDQQTKPKKINLFKKSKKSLTFIKPLTNKIFLYKGDTSYWLENGKKKLILSSNSAQTSFALMHSSTMDPAGRLFLYHLQTQRYKSSGIVHINWQNIEKNKPTKAIFNLKKHKKAIWYLLPPNLPVLWKDMSTSEWNQSELTLFEQVKEHKSQQAIIEQINEKNTGTLRSFLFDGMAYTDTCKILHAYAGKIIICIGNIKIFNIEQGNRDQAIALFIPTETDKLPVSVKKIDDIQEAWVQQESIYGNLLEFLVLQHSANPLKTSYTLIPFANELHTPESM